MSDIPCGCLKHLLLAQAAAESQKRGKPGQLVDPRPLSVNGETKIIITPQLVHDIFEEFPIVAKAYRDNVPEKVLCFGSCCVCVVHEPKSVRSFLKETSGAATSSQNFSTPIEPPSVLLQRSMS